MSETLAVDMLTAEGAAAMVILSAAVSIVAPLASVALKTRPPVVATAVGYH